MTVQFTNLGPRGGAELFAFAPPYRAFLKFITTSTRNYGSRKLKLKSRGGVVGHVIFRWREATRHVRSGQVYQKARGALDDIVIPERFSDNQAIEMIREAMEEAGWKFYIYQPEDPASYEEEQFEAWVNHQLRPQPFY